MVHLITVDLDDTLMPTAHYYDAAIDEFAKYVADRFGVDATRVQERQREIDYRLLEEKGLEKERFPESFVLTLEEFAPDAADEHFKRVRDIGFEVYQTREEYRETGFLDGAKEMLDELRNQTDELRLITAGDERVQQPKIDALGLEQWFDDIHIVPHDVGKAAIIERCVAETGAEPHRTFHIGNSLTSDIEAAVDAGVHAVHVNSDTDWLAERGEDNLEKNATKAGLAVYVFNRPIDVRNEFSSVVDAPETGVIRRVNA